MDTGPKSPKSPKSPTFRITKNLEGREVMIHNLKSAVNLEKASKSNAEETRKSYWVNHYKNDRKVNYPSLIEKIQNNITNKPKAIPTKLQPLNPITRKMISEKAKDGLNLHRLVLSKKKKKKLLPISETIPQGNIHSFNKLGLSKDVFYLPEREKAPKNISHVTRNKFRKINKKKLPKLNSRKTTTTLFENHRKINDSWKNFHKKTKKNPGYSRNVDRFISKHMHNSLF